MARFIFDLESDGLLDEATKVHMLVLQDLDTDELHVFTTQPGHRPVVEGVELLQNADLIAGHNVIGFDLPLLKKLHGLEVPWQRVRDTLVLGRLVWPELAVKDAEARLKAAKRGSGWALDFPGNLTGSQSLEAWGRRLGCHKGEYQGDTRITDEKVRRATKWLEWNPDMHEYGIQDVVVTRKLWERIYAEEPAEEAVLLETQVAHILSRQERHGFCFDEARAAVLYAKLVQRREELAGEVRAVFKPLYLRDGPPKAAHTVPKRDNAKLGYCEGAAFTKVRLTEFNMTSREHVAYWLKLHYGWEPTEFTADGKPKVDDEVIGKLRYPEAKPLQEYFLVVKRIGALAEGGQAWMKQVKKDGRMHGRVNTNGAVTGRMTHSGPNMGQVPASRSPYGHECRELFYAPEGKQLVGIDADALELRDLAGYMAAYDGGAYVKTVLEGRKEDGTDMHSVNCRALGMDPKGKAWSGESGRDIAKRWFYAFIYGAGDAKLGAIQTGRPNAVVGKLGRASFLRGLPALGKLVTRVKAKAKEAGHLRGLDGRKLSVRSQHAALNTLLQSAGAIQMKRALCIFDDNLQASGLTPGVHYEFVANVHDEWQVEVDAGLADTVGRLGALAIQLAGESFAFRCPLAGNAEVGRSWADTH